jgi:hypothetical protein
MRKKKRSGANGGCLSFERVDVKEDDEERQGGMELCQVR